MRQFYKDPVFIGLMVFPIPFWLLLGSGNISRTAEHLTALITICLLYPIVEELLFRGTLQRWLYSKSHRVFLHFSLANILTSILFTLSHFVNQPPLWALATFIPSLAFGYVMDRHKTVLAPVVLHISYNLGYFLSFGLN